VRALPSFNSSSCQTDARGPDFGIRIKNTVKIARQISVQHTPTLTLDGIIQGHVFDGATVNGISSSWGAAEWADWLRKNVE